MSEREEGLVAVETSDLHSTQRSDVCMSIGGDVKRQRLSSKVGPTYCGVDLASLPKEQRAGVLNAARAEKATRELREKGRCEECALVVQRCICSGLAELRREVGAAGDLGVRFALWMHVSERVRASNTGKLMHKVLPDCEIFLHGVPAEAERFRIRRANCKTYVLYPSEDAVPLSTIVEDLCQAAGDTRRSSSSIASAPLVVLIDGTWDQAKRMHKALKDLPHIALEAEDGAGASGFTWRSQSEEGRVTTAEAGALVLEGLTTSSPVAAIGARCLRQAVSSLDRELQVQAHYSKLDPPRAVETVFAMKAKRGRAVDDGMTKPVCKHHIRGTCSYGDNCTFSHTEAPPV